MTPAQFKEQIEISLLRFDKETARLHCDTLIDFLYQSNQPFSPNIAKDILAILRSYRMFREIQQLTDAFVFTNGSDATIIRQYVQTLIERGSFTSALAIVRELIGEESRPEAANSEEIKEGYGLMGRLYKQLYINVAKRNIHNGSLLLEAVKAYKKVYDQRPGELWHAINLVALLKRAEVDGVSIEKVGDYKQIAQQIINTVNDKEKTKVEKSTTSTMADAWHYATAAEACVALEQYEDAEKWIAFYANSEKVDAFQLGGTLRQFEEVWQLEKKPEAENIFHVLRAELMKRDGGQLIIDASEMRRQELSVIPDKREYEKNFGNNIFIDFRSYKKGYQRCEAVARIGRSDEKGDGTGFILAGELIHSDLKGEPVLITNNHVVSEEDDIRKIYLALHPDEVVIFFEALDKKKSFSKVSVYWSSRPDDLDITILRFHKDDLADLKKLLASVEPYQLAPIAPIVSGDPKTDPRLYVIGHPKGGPLQFSMQDNLMLDYEDPRIHYRTPTEGGSSGSPVFNQEWKLLGVHHKGDEKLKKLNGSKGVYSANEGIYIQTILKRLKSEKK